MRACSVSEQDSHIPLDRRTFLRWLSRWWRGQHESGSPSFSISRIDKYRGTMRLRQERIDFAPVSVDCQRMRACFRWHHLLAAHRANIDDIYYPRIADGHIEVSGLRMQENHVRGAA